jgi:hypothetical protein
MPGHRHPPFGIGAIPIRGITLRYPNARYRGNQFSSDDPDSRQKPRSLWPVAREDSSCRLRVRYRTANLRGGLVLAQAFVDDLPQQIVLGPGKKLDLGDQLGADPMHAAEHQG